MNASFLLILTLGCLSCSCLADCPSFANEAGQRLARRYLTAHASARDESECIESAINHLGIAKKSEDVPLFIQYLDFEHKKAPGDEYFRKDFFNGGRYPAIEALAEVGDPSIPALVTVIASEPPGVRPDNALSAIRYIFRNDENGAVRLLRKHSEATKDPIAHERLYAAATRAAAGCGDAGSPRQAKCDAALAKD
jgi:hypothetical protein